MKSLKEIEDGLIEAQRKAEQLFDQIATRKIICAGKMETEINREVYDLAFEMFGIKKYWHKRIVRGGKNTLLPYKENPPDLKIQDDDIVFLDFGPIFEEWEADLGRTYVVGKDARKEKLARDIVTAWREGRQFFHEMPDITGRELFLHMCKLAEKFGWEFGGPHAGHLIGEFPHEKIDGDKIQFYIHPDNHNRMREPDEHGNPRHWILEAHFVDRAAEIGAFYEELLTLDS